MEESKMKKHVILVAALQIGFSVMGIIGATVLYFIFSFAAGFVEDVDIAGAVINFIGTFLPSVIILASLLGLIGGIGLLSFRKWARMLVMIMTSLGCFAFPVGTVIGVYSLWVLLQDETAKLFS
jgi:hypothetical protein